MFVRGGNLELWTSNCVEGKFSFLSLEEVGALRISFYLLGSKLLENIVFCVEWQRRKNI